MVRESLQGGFGFCCELVVGENCFRDVSGVSPGPGRGEFEPEGGVFIVDPFAALEATIAATRTCKANLPAKSNRGVTGGARMGACGSQSM